MNRAVASLMLVSPLFAACDEPSPTFVHDASCDEGAELTIGRCVDEARSPCTGAEAISGAFFDPMPVGGEIAPVIGPQGAAMFALAVRATDIAPGDPDSPFSTDNPILEIELIDAASGEHFTSYRGRSGFRAVDSMAGTFEHPQVFVVVDHSISSLWGERFWLDARLTDNVGELRCGSAEILAPDG